jgi:hypothetical protein
MVRIARTAKKYLEDKRETGVFSETKENHTTLQVSKYCCKLTPIQSRNPPRPHWKGRYKCTVRM